MSIDLRQKKFGSNHRGIGLPSCTSVVCVASPFVRLLPTFPPDCVLLCTYLPTYPPSLLLSSVYHVLPAGNRRLSLSSCMYLYACIIRITVCSFSGTYCYVGQNAKYTYTIIACMHAWCRVL
ncbi:hypothetical protein L226DRAFT_69385 [Lentinus tigrinus ALCF2SS1-7]|uniref:uncharacterized protein n=1 Tax=Lentinus tigrinus ALCF2SS1-7 TaxID=1328758 RepID=UPI001166372A|nr:hypothetical protein L226DRAFT_69385 [Lentinus tigrinus ALCF2SS1-7]